MAGTCARSSAGSSGCGPGRWSRSTCSASSSPTSSSSTWCISRSAPRIYALGALMLTMVAADAVLDRQAVWEALDRPGIPRRRGRPCAIAGRRSEPAPSAARSAASSTRRSRGAAIALRRAAATICTLANRHSIGRTWALIFASIILYVPANLYPVLTVMQLGSGEPGTILGGAGSCWPGVLAARIAGLRRLHDGPDAEAHRV